MAAIAVEGGLPAFGCSGGGGELHLFGVPIAFHETVEVAAIPCGGLRIEDGADFGVVGGVAAAAGHPCGQKDEGQHKLWFPGRL